MARIEVAVIGSLNLDLVVPVPRHPRPGETVLGGDHFTNPGGKGANQAVAAARLGRRVAMVGRVGDDPAGRTLLGAVSGAGVDVSHVGVTEGVPTGLAVVMVDEHGENAIVVSAGANARLSGADVTAAGPMLREAAVTLVQLEVPLDAVEEAVARAGSSVILNPAPATPLPDDLLAGVDVLVPNRTELAALVGGCVPDTLPDAEALARRCRCPAVVVTLGARGALLVQADRAVHVVAPEVQVVDTTAAGDCFCGALADALVRGEPLEAAVRWAVRAAALATTRPGALASLPTAEEVRAT